MKARDPTTIEIRLSGRVPREQLVALCDRVGALLIGGVEHVVCDVEDLFADAVAVDALARLVVTARRAGADLRICNPCSSLTELLELVALADVVREV